MTMHGENEKCRQIIQTLSGVQPHNLYFTTCTPKGIFQSRQHNAHLRLHNNWGQDRVNTIMVNFSYFHFSFFSVVFWIFFYTLPITLTVEQKNLLRNSTLVVYSWCTLPGTLELTTVLLVCYVHLYSTYTVLCYTVLKFFMLDTLWDSSVNFWTPWKETILNIYMQQTCIYVLWQVRLC
jgi:hypothetical protein